MDTGLVNKKSTHVKRLFKVFFLWFSKEDKQLLQFIPFEKWAEVLCPLCLFLWRLQKIRVTTKTVLRANREGMIITASSPVNSSRHMKADKAYFRTVCHHVLISEKLRKWRGWHHIVCKRNSASSCLQCSNSSLTAHGQRGVIATFCVHVHEEHAVFLTYERNNSRSSNVATRDVYPCRESN